MLFLTKQVKASGMDVRLKLVPLLHGHLFKFLRMMRTAEATPGLMPCHASPSQPVAQLKCGLYISSWSFLDVYFTDVYFTDLL